MFALFALTAALAGFRRWGLGAYFVQELKRECRALGAIPAERCNPGNVVGLRLSWMPVTGQMHSTSPLPPQPWAIRPWRGRDSRTRKEVWKPLYRHGDHDRSFSETQGIFQLALSAQACARNPVVCKISEHTKAIFGEGVFQRLLCRSVEFAFLPHFQKCGVQLLTGLGDLRRIDVPVHDQTAPCEVNIMVHVREHMERDSFVQVVGCLAVKNGQAIVVEEFLIPDLL